jgi:hypothetical protein
VRIKSTKLSSSHGAKPLIYNVSNLGNPSVTDWRCNNNELQFNKPLNTALHMTLC